MKFIAQIKTVKSNVDVSNDQVITVTLITDSKEALKLCEMQGEKLVEVEVNDRNTDAII